MKTKKEDDRDKISPDIILKAVKAVKIQKIIYLQAALEFNINYRALNHCCKKDS